MRLPAITILSLFLCACATDTSHPYPEVKVEGNTQGTTYHITYLDSLARNFKSEIDSILLDFDATLSTYNPASVITAVNRIDSGGMVRDQFHYLATVIEKSINLHELTNGVFDPTVEPLMKAWGVEQGKLVIPDSTTLDSILQLVGLQKLVVYPDQVEQDQLVLTKPAGMLLNFNAIAQGYAVDVLSDFLEQNGIQNYLVEIGGELRCKGVNKANSLWSIGVDKPSDGAERSIKAKIEIKDKAVATSGSYRKFVEKNKVRYSHILNPKTGYPVTHTLISVTVVANDCATADALATAFLVMGREETIRFIEANKNLSLEVYLISETGEATLESWSSDGLLDVLESMQ